jgi:hypothetical protein
VIGEGVGAVASSTTLAQAGAALHAAMGRRPDRCLGGPPLSTRRVTWLKLLENRAGMPPRSGLVGSAALLVAWYQQRVSAKASGRRSLSHAAVPARSRRQSGLPSIFSNRAGPSESGPRPTSATRSSRGDGVQSRSGAGLLPSRPAGPADRRRSAADAAAGTSAVLATDTKDPAPLARGRRPCAAPVGSAGQELVPLPRQALWHAGRPPAVE